jgi:hypothetical protein
MVPRLCNVSLKRGLRLKHIDCWDLKYQVPFTFEMGAELFYVIRWKEMEEGKA